MSSDRVSGEGQGQECCRRGGVEAVAGTGILGTDQAGPEKQVGLAPPCKSSVLSRGKGCATFYEREVVSLTTIWAWTIGPCERLMHLEG